MCRISPSPFLRDGRETLKAVAKCPAELLCDRQGRALLFRGKSLAIFPYDEIAYVTRVPVAAGLKSIRVGIWPEQAPLLEPPDHSPDFFARIRGKYALAFGRGQTDFQKASDLLHCLRVIVEPALILKDRRVIEFGKINHQRGALGNLRKSTVEGMTKALHNGRDGIAWIPNREEHVGCRKVCEKLEGARRDMRLNDQD